MKKHNLLIVDDDKVVLTTVRSILGEDYNLDLANNGMLALRFLEKKDYDLILLDVMMPQMDGMETYRRIRQMDKCRELPIIFLTGDQNTQTEVECLKMGAADFITKPIVQEVMKSRIAKTIALHEFQTDLEAHLEEAEENLRLSMEERERIAAELNVAAQIQIHALPSTFPDRKEVELYACMKPAKEVGGDFYDYFFMDPDHLCIVIADVSGKGVPASLFMMTSKTRIQDHALVYQSPATILEKVNNLLCQNNDLDMFVTVWIGVLEISTGKLTTVNAGHEYPIIKRAGKPFELIKDKHYPALSVMEGMHYKETVYQLEPGDLLYLYTDGVPEATNSEEKLFGRENMLQALNQSNTDNVKAVTEAMEQAVNNFTNSAPQFDDITMVCVKYRG